MIPGGLRGALHGHSFGFLSNFFRPRLPDFRRGTPQSRNGRGRRAPARSGPRRPADQPDPAQPSGRETARSARSARVSPRVSGRVSRLGRTRRRRTLLLGIRPGGGLSSPRRPPVPGGVSRCDDRRDGLRHLVCVQPLDRALPGRRRGLPRRHEAARTARGRRVRMRPDRGLRIDDHRLRRDRVRRGLQFSARRMGEPEARGGGSRPRPPGRPEPPRRQRVRHVPSPDLPRLRRDACPHDRLRPLHPRLRASGGSSRGGRGGAPDGVRAGAAPDALHPPARLLSGRRHVHRHRGRLERSADSSGAPGGQREEDHAVHGALAGVHGRGHSVLLPPDPRAIPPRQDAELGAGRKPLRAVEARVSSDRPDSRHRHHGLGGSAALRRGADRVHRRAAHPGQHGRRFLDAAALRPALGPAGHEERHLPDGRRRRRRAPLFARQERSADPDVLDQRLSDVHPDRARDVALLDPKPPGASGLAPQPGHPRNGPDDVPPDSDRQHPREVHGRGAGSPSS